MEKIDKTTLQETLKFAREQHAAEEAQMKAHAKKVRDWNKRIAELSNALIEAYNEEAREKRTAKEQQRTT